MKLPTLFRSDSGGIVTNWIIIFIHTEVLTYNFVNKTKQIGTNISAYFN